ncbi:hypothetical protein JCM10213_005367 [Rhodosporidiobolus nylandii]
MNAVAGGALAAETHNAGGVGFIGASHKGRELLEKEVGIARERLGLAEREELPLGAGLVLWRFEPPFARSASAGLAEATLWLRYILFVARVRHLWLSFSSEGAAGLEKWVGVVRQLERDGPKKEDGERERKERVKVWTMVASEEAGRQAREWDVDAVVAQGTEAGGHGPTYASGSPLLPLLRSLSPLYPPVSPPFLLAAGGLASPASISSALSSGASGAVIGTALEVALESLLPPAQKDLLVRAKSAEETDRGIKWDIARDGRNVWPGGVDGRALRNVTSREEIEEGGEEWAHERYKKAVEEKDVERVVTWAGTGVGDISSIRPAREIVQELMGEKAGKL